MSSPPREDGEHPTPPPPSPPPSPPLTEMIFRKPEASDQLSDGNKAISSLQRSPLRNDAKDPSLPPDSPPLTEMIFQEPEVSDRSNDGSTATGSPQRSRRLNDVKDPIPPSFTPPLTEMSFRKPQDSDDSRSGNTATRLPQRSPLSKEPKYPSSPLVTEIVFPEPQGSDDFVVSKKPMDSSRRSPPGDDAKALRPPPPSPPLLEMHFQKTQPLDHPGLDKGARMSSSPPPSDSAEHLISWPSAEPSDTENLSASSLQPSSPRNGEYFSPSTSPPESETGLPIPKSANRKEESLASPTLSPLRLIKGTARLPPGPPLPRPPTNTPEKPASPAVAEPVAAMAVASRLSRENLAVVAKVVRGGGAGAGVTGMVDGVGRGDGGGGWPGERGHVALPRGAERGDASVAALGLRVAALVLSLIAFSLMAADKTDGWAGDSYDRYEEFRFLVTANVIAFVYSGFQVYAAYHHRIAKKHILRRPIRQYFDLSMDQILSYLLMSASSAAASRNDIWVSRFDGDKFTHRVDGSVAMSFLAFLALATNSIISAYKLFKLGS